MSNYENTGEHHDVVIVGAGQAGLSLSWHLTRSGVDHVLLERTGVASDWKQRRWDNFTLVTPNWQCQLPGYSYSGPAPDGFMGRDDVYAFVRDYAASFNAPVQTGVEVTEVVSKADGRYRINSTAAVMTAGNVVIATGGYHRPTMPAVAQKLHAAINQLHSADYRNAGALPDGSVLVVGSGQSGAQIAEDLHLAGRQVHLAVGSAPRVARFYRGRDCVAWLHDMGTYDVPVENQPGGLTKREKTNHYVTGRDGGRDIDLRRFALEGMKLYGRLDEVQADSLTFRPTLEAALDGADLVAESIKDIIDRYISQTGIEAPFEDRYVPVWKPEEELTSLDLTAAGITTVIWAVGFQSDYSWVKVGTFDGGGHPSHVRGVTSVPGLYFLGLPWLHTWGSGRFAGIARDAAYLADVIVQRTTAEDARFLNSAAKQPVTA
ncbi:MSMEG_0569 family flavin-dependent oxidoreductase [Arthrobacter sp. Y81]|uniref:MSMEG_0569 family flavin-dependent oxidoreductase n=1 Tax=Arthrobacter sp. Y81 TaxID=2058897 RepID=UPI000CE54980|nr:MSMEG_0569 family flavin-dependent oxidoreductase [Arthrobacter sp. Y81]